MHSKATVIAALELHEAGLNNCDISRRTGVSRPTIRDWINGRLPHSYRPRGAHGDRLGHSACQQCGGVEHNFDRLGADYIHLLGLYLGDGSIAEHRRRVFRLRITLDVRYPDIVRECEAAMRAVVPRNRVNRQLRRCNCYEVHAYWKGWPCLFPQHGVGKKHLRPIFLAEWQQKLAERWPKQLIKGLIQSDGCRSYSTGRGGWTQPRYAFSNVSTDITSIFCSACDCLGLRWTASFPADETAAVSIYVSRKADVAKLDEFVGPKR
ncbi:MAG: helix-turn-helix domain-containing protein [Solirubrobacterales bacterium]